MPTPNLPPGFDFLDPDVHVERLPVEELAELRKEVKNLREERDILRKAVAIFSVPSK